MRNVLPALFQLSLVSSTGEPGDSSDDPVLIDDDVDVDGDDGAENEVELVSSREFEAAVAARRLGPLVAPGLAVRKVVHAGRQMRGLFAARSFKKCEPIGVYDGEVLTVPEYESARRPLAKDYAFETGIIRVHNTQLRLMIVPHLRSDGSVDYKRHPLSLLNEPVQGSTANVVMQQIMVDPVAMEASGPSSGQALLEPYLFLCAFAARNINAGEELTLFYGKGYEVRRDYGVGRDSNTWCNTDLTTTLFPQGIPWSAIATITSDMLDPEDSGSDDDWVPRGTAAK